MKIEKLTENKIRVIMNIQDLEDNHIDLQTLMTKAFENQTLFSNMLSKAEQELGFHTDGCRLLIEGFSSIDDNFIFTITKYEKTNRQEEPSIFPRKKLTVKRKSINLKNANAIYRFENFENFCEFCQFLNNIHQFECKKMSKDFSLYLFNNAYYLTISNINITYPNLKNFYSAISEFGKSIPYSNSLHSKLSEHGKIIMKKNAICTGIKFFCAKKQI